MRSIPLATRKQLLSASGLALATALVAAGPALRAQSFQATPTSTFGSVTINTTPTTTAITVSSPSAVINWTPTDTATTGGPIIFQTSGTTATFTNNPAANSDFTVLNRIIPSGSTRPIQFDGTVVSRLQSAAGGQTAGGTVFFYSPGGILIGASSVFDVGNLVLTTSDLNYNTTDGSFDTSGAYVFQPATVAGSQIVVSAGAQLGATTDGSYIAMVAPSVTNNGTITVNGSAALVAADAATITFSPSGLFDIQVDSGTSATGTVAANNGTITGPAASDPAFFHRIYMVAVPKNDAITMAIGAGSTLGFDIAGAANTAGNAIVLSAGNDIQGGVSLPGPSAGGGSGTASISGVDANVTSTFSSTSTGQTQFVSVSSAGMDFASDVVITGRGVSGIIAQANGVITVGGDLSIDTVSRSADPTVEALGGTALVLAEGGSIQIAGDAGLYASAFGATSNVAGQAAGNARAGAANMQARSGGSITIGGDAFLEAVGQGGGPVVPGSAGGVGRGGTTLLEATGQNSTLSIAGSLNVNALGEGDNGSVGGAGYGGAMSVLANGNSQLSVGGASTFIGTGTGGDGDTDAAIGQGGSLTLNVSNDATITLHDLDIRLQGLGGSGATRAGVAHGGTATLRASGTSVATPGAPGTASLTVNGATNISVEGLGGQVTASGGADAATNGGSVLVEAADGNTVALTGDVFVVADGAADGINSNVNPGNGGTIEFRALSGADIALGSTLFAQARGIGGTGTGSAAAGSANGGVVRLTADNGALEVAGSVNLSTDAIAGSQNSGGLGGSAQGGATFLAARNGGNLALRSDLTATGLATGGSGGAGGTGGEAIGGEIVVSAGTNSSLSVASDVELDVGSEGGQGLGTLNGGRAEGGGISLRAFGPGTGSGLTFGGRVGLYANPLAGDSAFTGGTGGEAVGGTLTLLADGANISVNGTLELQSQPFAGSGFVNGADGFGGNAIIEARNAGRISVSSDIGVYMESEGGEALAAGSGIGGSAHGGNINVTANGGIIEASQNLLLINRTFGSGGPAGGGSATSAFLTISTSGNGAITAGGELRADARARAGTSFSGTGGAGGTAQGGTVRLFMGGGLVSAGNLTIDASGEGGGGTTGGAGLGGALVTNINSANITVAGISSINAIGVGGAASGSDAAGQGTGGSINLGATASNLSLGGIDGATLDASGYAGAGGPAIGQGGTVNVTSTTSTIGTQGILRLIANGTGSASRGGASGGNGFGGAVSVTAGAALTASTAISASAISISTVGQGGAGSTASAIGGVGGNGGVGQGGTINLNAAVDGGTITTSQLNANASGVGGFGASGTMNTPNGDRGGNGGAATGGLINMNSIAASGGSGTGGYDLGFGVLNAGAIGGAGGSGGEGPTPGAGGNGGAATGGTINMAFDRGGSRLTVSDGLNVLADATGGNSGTCGITCTAAGGNAQGGSVNFGSGGATTGNSVSIVGGLNLSAFGSGGGSYGAPGGNGIGGVAIIHLGSGLALNADGVTIDAAGEGGDQFTSLAGGNGTGGNASFIASGTSTATISGTISLYSDGTGGDGRDVGANGGSGTGGISRLYSDGGTVSVTGGASVEASGFGGFGYLDGASGTGGAGAGGQALLTVGTPDAIGNNGSITVGGFSFVTAEGTGGDSFRGGVGTGGFVGISARQGTLSLDQTFATADGFGGYGQFGGAGGVAQGGGIEVYANSALEGASLVTINTLTADSSAFGGFGGLAATPTGTGGVGGDATAGTIAIFGTAGNGGMQIGSVLASASGQGGGGGDGLAGGLGGNGNGGFVQIGTASGLDTGTLNTGSGTYGSILTIASGVGGDGGSGDASTGTGGAGGSGRAGGSLLLVRGSSTTVTGTGSFNAHAQGGNGGSGATVGAGGDATVGVSTNPAQASGAGLVVTSRFQQPSQSGSLTAGDLNFSAIAAGGTGSVAGVGTVTGDAVDFEMLNSSLSGTNLSFSALADGVTAGALPDYIALTNSTANLSGSLSFSTPNAFSLQLDQSNLTAASVAIDAGNWVLPATAPATYGTLTGTSSVSLSSGQDIIAYANLSTQGTLTLQAVGRIFLGSLSALGAVDVTAGGSLTLGDVASGDSIDLTSQAVAALGNMTAGTSITVQSASSVTTGNLAAGTGTPTGANGDLNSIGITSGGNVQTGTIFAASDVGISAAGTLTTGLVRAYDTLLLAGSSATIDSLSIVNRTLIANASMAALGQTPAGFDKELVFAAAPVATNGPIQITNASGSGSLTAAAGGSLTTGNITVSNSLRLSAGGSATLGQLTAGTGTPTAGGAGLISIASSGNVSTGNLTSSGDVRVVSGGGLSTGTVVGYDVLLGSVGDLSVTSMNVVNRVLIANSSMQALGQTANGFDKELVFAATPMALTGAVTISNNSTVGTLRIAAGTTVTTANVFAAGRIGVTGNGAMNFGSLQSQSDRIEVISRNGTVTASALLSSSDILASGAAGLTVGTVRGRDLVLLSSGNISVQTALAGVVFDPQTNQVTNAVGRILMANSTMLPVTGALPGSINYAGLFAATPIKTDGNINVGNVAVAGQIVSATAGSFTGAGMAGFSRIEVLADGLVTVGRRWGGPQVRIVSGDIAIIDNGTATGPTGQPILSGIRTSETGFVDLISTSTGTALIGDGLTGSGYALSNAEIGLISTSELTIAAVDQPNNATDMLIGNLSLTAGGAIGSSNLAGTTGRIIFASGNLQTQTPGGAIRVTGAINGTGFGQGNVIEFTTGRFELDAATGSINLTSASQSGATAPLGGTLEINAANIHVAAGSILDKLAADPFYTGRIAELNAPAAVQRPEGVIRALGLDLYPTGTLYIQNTGTVLNSAGFLADADFTDVTAPTNATPGSISIVVNGAFQTPTGIVSGVAAHDLVVNAPDADFTPYTADSQINGCLFTATACSSAMEGPDTIGAISGQIEIISNETLGSTPTFTESPAAPTSDAESDDPAQEEQQQQQQASEGEEAASSPIAPPPQLIDSRPLEPQSQVEQPVAGSGNPALIGSVVNENSAEGDDQ